MIIIYTVDDLKPFNYFNDIDITYLLDSLTGVISRQYILDYAKHLISLNKPFAMIMMDLDNFKFINDTYGHKAGDICLKEIGESLRVHVGSDGLVGRFGGDEFIIIYTKANDYDTLHEFLMTLYESKGVIRKNIMLDKVKTFVTATLGSASFPLDAETYDELFMKMDKALYRGKSKGRNCFIIYVDSKHRDIVVKERGVDSLLNKFLKIEQLMETKDDYKAVTDLIDYLYRVLHPYNMLFIDNRNYIWSGNNTKYYYCEDYEAYRIFTEMLKNKNVLASSNTMEVMEKYPDAYSFLKSRNVQSLVIVKVKGCGFLGLYENSIIRLWQDSDLALLFYAAQELRHRLK